jgi:hypothetical protein
VTLTFDPGWIPQLAVAELDRKKMEEKLDRRKLSESSKK